MNFGELENLNDSELFDLQNKISEIVKQRNLEKGDISLDDAIKAYEKGSILKDQCEKRLNEAKLKVEEIEEKENKNKNLKQSLDE